MTDYMELWNQSRWLSNSAKVHAAHYYKKEWNSALAQSGNRLWIEDFKDAIEEGKSGGYERWELLAFGAHKLTEQDRPKKLLLDRATKEVIQRLREGTYRAFGFDRPRTLDTIPVQIPREAWARAYNLETNKLDYQSLQFVDVRVRMVREEADPILKKPFEALVAKAGRPTVGPAIEAAFHALLKIGEIDPSASQKSHYPKVRKWIESDYADLNVPPASISDKTIHKFFSPLFKTLTESSNL